MLVVTVVLASVLSTSPQSMAAAPQCSTDPGNAAAVEDWIQLLSSSSDTEAMRIWDEEMCSAEQAAVEEIVTPTVFGTTSIGDTAPGSNMSGFHRENESGDLEIMSTSSSSSSSWSYQTEYDGVNCRRRGWVTWGENAVGHKLWEYHTRIRWCWDKGTKKFTKKSRDRWAEVNSLVWDFAGHISNYKDTYNSGKSHEWRTQGKFVLGTTWLPIQTKLPWTRWYVHGGGGYSVSYGF